MLSTTDAPAHELNALAVQLRARSIRRWQPFATGEPSRTWALVNALDGLGDLVATGELDVEDALEEFAFLVSAARAVAR